VRRISAKAADIEKSHMKAFLQFKICRCNNPDKITVAAAKIKVFL
jgi:hypothetical protein